ncbi:hypothetical protein ES704_01389 [subsurface metagenome]|jgi:uncharacterized membrane protein
MGKVITFCIAGFLIAYYAFTSGAVFELTKSEATERLDVPYSIALSNERTRIIGVYDNNDDTDCARWLVEEADPSTPVYVDYCSVSLIMDLSETRRATYEEPKEKHYLFLTSWSTEHKKMVFGWFEGLREYEPLPDLSNATEVFRRGSAVVYICEVGD